MKSSFAPFFLAGTNLYLLLEGRKYLFFPVHMKWYDLIVENDLLELERANPEGAKQLAEENLEQAKE